MKDFFLGKYEVNVLHLKDSFVNFRCDGDNIFTRFYITMGYSDVLIDFDDGEGQRRKGQVC